MLFGDSWLFWAAQLSTFSVLWNRAGWGHRYDQFTKSSLGSACSVSLGHKGFTSSQQMWRNQSVSELRADFRYHLLQWFTHGFKEPPWVCPQSLGSMPQDSAASILAVFKLELPDSLGGGARGVCCQWLKKKKKVRNPPICLTPPFCRQRNWSWERIVADLPPTPSITLSKSSLS